MYSTVSRCRCRCAHCSLVGGADARSLHTELKAPILSKKPRNHETSGWGPSHNRCGAHRLQVCAPSPLGRPPVRSPKSLHYTSHHTDSFFTSGSACSSLSSHVYTAARGSASRTDTAVTSGCERVTASSIQFPLAVGLGLRNNSYSMRARDESSLTGFAQEFDRGSAPMGLQTAPLRA